MPTLTATPAWRALEAQAQTERELHLNSLFANDPERATRYAAEAVGIYLDYSKQRVSDEGLTLLLQLAEQQGLQAAIARMFGGERINHTENRAVLHVALRAPRSAGIRVGDEDVSAEVHEVLGRMRTFAQQLRSGEWLSASGERITDVVNIGIGGSDLGPRMVVESLEDFCDGPRAHFVANVDAAQLYGVLQKVPAKTTLFVITSKTFTTQETMANARSARRWLVDQLGEEAVAKHFVAVSTNAAEVERFGIDQANMFGFWDWVGGRYSAWSAVGLSLMCAIGPERFDAWLVGAHDMDEHFRSAPIAQNLPALMGLLSVWNVNFLHTASQVVAPYAQKLARFVAWLQQLEMESNGKGVHSDGSAAEIATTPALWGDVGTNGQHAFFQMIHQGTGVHPVDFILPLKAEHPYDEQHRILIANCLAQSAALMRGKTASQVHEELKGQFSGDALDAAVPHRVFPGNRPSNTLLLPRLDPYNLGALMALYEHRTFVEAVIWDINAFDQWGVELGKRLAQDVLKAIAGADVGLDASTLVLLERALKG